MKDNNFKEIKHIKDLFGLRRDESRLDLTNIKFAKTNAAEDLAMILKSKDNNITYLILPNNLSHKAGEPIKDALQNKDCRVKNVDIENDELNQKFSKAIDTRKKMILKDVMYSKNRHIDPIDPKTLPLPKFEFLDKKDSYLNYENMPKKIHSAKYSSEEDDFEIDLGEEDKLEVKSSYFSPDNLKIRINLSYLPQEKENYLQRKKNKDEETLSDESHFEKNKKAKIESKVDLEENYTNNHNLGSGNVTNNNATPTKSESTVPNTFIQNNVQNSAIKIFNNNSNNVNK